MKYFVRIGAQTVEVEVDGARVVVGGEELEVHLAAIPGDRKSTRLNSSH